VVGLGDTSVSIDVQDMLIHAKMMRGCIEEEPDVHRFTPELVHCATGATADYIALSGFDEHRQVTRRRKTAGRQPLRWLQARGNPSRRAIRPRCTSLVPPPTTYMID
jgi:hypothetical protein